MGWRGGAIAAMATLVAAGGAQAEDGCVLQSRYSPGKASEPTHRVSFVFTGVEHEVATVAVDDLPIFERQLETPDWSTEYSGDGHCLLAGRYTLQARIGEARGIVTLEITDQMTIYLSKVDGAVAFNIWGPNAPGLD
jgi:hypothetical protein